MLTLREAVATAAEILATDADETIDEDAALELARFVVRLGNLMQCGE